LSISYRVIRPRFSITCSRRRREEKIPDRTIWEESKRFHSTVREADQILVLADGRITEMGKHEELLGRKGLYARLYRTQFREETA